MKRIMAVVVVLLSVAGCSSDAPVATDAPNTDAPVATDAPNTDAPNTDAPVATDAPAPSETVGQENARESAQSYLDSQAFSRTGLIDQLLFEGFSQADAEYGTDSIRADWNQQAALSAQSYLDSQVFSRTGLIDQLLFEGFSQAEAEYGVNAVGL